ncbi:DMT family transporter [Methylobacterium symbioticum]|uniref:Putative inner membrane transporter YedA n=1 Tax=Methylobacterium symbioticum TaxID=2584084 RepID=A0A509EH43_9HYPH|nr:DMT family transporter [Methylobacterium symbioticum]VUD73697.1 putative inner membrane transporter YedA [Methylobacterium symbioticum]
MPPAIHRTMTASEWTLLLVLSLLWGGSFFFTGVALTALPPLTVVLLRVGLAALILGLSARLAGARLPREAGIWRAFLGMGILNNVVPFCLIVWSQTHIASGLAAILNAATPLFAVIVAHRLTADERMTGNRLVGVLIGFAGVAVMVGPSVLGGGGEWPAELASLGAALTYAFAGVYGRRFGRMGVPPLVTAAGQVAASTLVLLPVVLVVDRPWTLPAPGPVVWAAVLGAAALSTALAFVIYFRLLATAGAANVLLVTLLVPVSAILLGALVLGERLEPRHYGGMAVIALALAAVDGRLLRLARPGRVKPLEPCRGRDA